MLMRFGPAVQTRVKRNVSACAFRVRVRVPGCGGTRASVASSAHSLSLIQLAAIWCGIPFQGRGGEGEEDHRESLLSLLLKG